MDEVDRLEHLKASVHTVTATKPSAAPVVAAPPPPVPAFASIPISSLPREGMRYRPTGQLTLGLSWPDLPRACRSGNSAVALATCTVVHFSPRILTISGSIVMIVMLFSVNRSKPSRELLDHVQDVMPKATPGSKEAAREKRAGRNADATNPTFSKLYVCMRSKDWCCRASHSDDDPLMGCVPCLRQRQSFSHTLSSL